MRKKIILVGGFSETIELCDLCNYDIVGIIDKGLQGDLMGYPILGDDSKAKEIYTDYSDIPVIIAMDKPGVRKKLFKLYREIGFKIEKLISPNAFISPSAEIGEGCIIQSFCNISTNVILGDGIKINTYANIMHDVVLSDYVTVAPNAVILGAVKVGEGAYIGANSTIIQTNKIGDYATVGAGAVVTGDIKSRDTVIGVPARSMGAR